MNEIQPAASLLTGCTPGYGKTASIGTINDFGVVNGTVTCYTNVIADPVSFQYQTGSMVAAPWFDSFALPTSSPGQSYSYTITNRGEAFGYEGPVDIGGLYATRWSLAGGHERIFFDPACNSIQFTAAVDGNGRYTVGWGLRGDPSLPPPIDELCISTRWLIRDAAGVETSGPLYGSPSSMNAFSVAVGTSNRSAVRYHVPSGELRVLHAADPLTAPKRPTSMTLAKWQDASRRVRSRYRTPNAFPVWPCAGTVTVGNARCRTCREP